MPGFRQGATARRSTFSYMTISTEIMGREPRYLGGPRHGQRADRHESPALQILWLRDRADGHYFWVQKHARYEWRSVNEEGTPTPAVIE